jgi:hypothetical protein
VLAFEAVDFDDEEVGVGHGWYPCAEVRVYA